MKKSLLSILLFLVTTSFVSAEVVWLNNDISIDTSNVTKRIGKGAECGPNLPPNWTCDLSCYEGTNNEAKMYNCTVGMTALYYEEFTVEVPDTPLYGVEDYDLMSSPSLATETYRSGNTLETLDARTVIFYPYQAIRLCFNLGRPLTTQGVNWVLAEGYPTADADPASCMEAASPTALW